MNNTINSKDSPVFKTDQPHSRYFMKGWLISAGLLSLPVLYDWIFPSTYITDKYYWVVGAMLILRFISEASKDRLMEICFDKEKNQILFTYKGVFSAEKQKALSLENARLEIAETQSGWTWLWEPLTLYFLHNKTEVFEIRRSKDGSSVDTLNRIAETAAAFSVPIKRL